MPVRRAPFIALALTLAAATGSIVAAGPATAATTWFVATSGTNAAGCGTNAAPCNSIATVIAKPAFVSGETINVAAGTYVGVTTFSAKGANVVGTGVVNLDGNAAGSTVAVTGNVPVQLTNLTLKNGLNNSSFGGGLRVQAGTVTTTDVTISGNKSIAGAGAIVYGGATLNMTDGSISGNTTATSGGGGLYNAGTTKLTNVNVTGNAGSTGAGLFNAAGVGLTVDGGSITNNAATSVGGGVYALGPTTTLNNVTTNNNTAVYGGGAAVGNAATLNVSGGSFSSNTVTAVAALQGWGGGVYVAGKTASAATGVLNISGTTINDNVATGSTFTAAGLGGGILNSGTATIVETSFSGNRVSGTGSVGGWGGAIYNGGSAPAVPLLTITDSQIKGGGVTNAVAGGGIAAPNSFSASGLTVSGNVAQLGGGIYSSGNVSLTNSFIKNNQATHASVGIGGGIDVVRPSATLTSTVTLDNTDVTGNTSAVYGGGVGNGFGVTTEIRNGSAIDGNTSVVGGGIQNYGGLTVRDSSVSSNSASFQGGGVYNGSSVATETPALNLINAAVDNNTAASGGGGLLTLKGATLTASGGHVNGNSGIGGGGVIVGDAGSATFDGTDFIGNTASNLGGGAILSSGTTTVSHSTLRDNVAAHTTGITGIGAAIYSGSSTANAITKLTVRTSTISGNEGFGAAAILTYSTGAGATNTASIDNSTITANTNTAAVGAIELLHPATITNSTITGNTATGGASGSFYVPTPSQLGLAGSIISGNSGPECSGAVTDGGRNLSDVGDASCGFTPAKNDVAGAPLLGALANNGGPTKTLLPGPASPALDRIPASTATGLSDAVTGTAVTLCSAGNKDQRDIARPQGAKCDIGAVEVTQVAPEVSGPVAAHYTLNSDGAPVTFTTTGTPQAVLTFTGTLPAGVSFHDNGDGTATLSGHPTAGSGEYPLTIKGTNEAGTGTLSFMLNLHVAPVLTGPMASTYTVGQVGGPDLFTQTGGFPEATLSSTALPGGLDFTPQSGGKGTISGTPHTGTGGHYNVTITGDNGTPPPATWPFSLTVNEAPGLDGPASTTFTVGSAGNSAAFTTTGFPSPALTATGLPDGLSISGNGTATITGTPAPGTGGEYDATVKASNDVGNDATKGVHVTVKQAPALVGPSDAHLPAGVYGEVVFSSDGYPVAEITQTGNLPDGLSFIDHHNGTATLGGTPTSASAGHYEVTVRASNGVAPDSVIELSLEIIPHLAITSTTLPDAPYKTTYSSTVNITGGMPPFTFSLVSGSLPQGLTLNANGTVTGSATGPIETRSVVVEVTDAANPSVSTTKSLTIKTVKGETALAVEPVYLKLSSANDPQANLYVGTLRATLTGGSPALPLAGQPIVFKALGMTVCTATTDATGKVICPMNILAITWVTLAGGVDATYAGSTVWVPASGSNKLVAQSPAGS